MAVMCTQAKWMSAAALLFILSVSDRARGEAAPASPQEPRGAVSGQASVQTNAQVQDAEALERELEKKKPRPGLLDQQHTVAEFEAGVLALPTAPISASQRGGDTPFGTIGKGDATILTGLHLLYRGSPEWALGAGFSFAPRPTSDAESGGNSGIDRSHSRSYLLVGVEGRYFPFRYRVVEAWVGLAGSVVVVADRYSWESATPVPAILGSRTVTIRSEGFSLGVQAGGNWMFAEKWVLGVTTRVSRWILPQTPSCSPVGDCATLSGTVEAFELGLNLGYRIPL